MRRRHNEVRGLCKAVETYRAEQKGKLDQCALKVLDRLANSSDAGNAFDGLKLNGEQEALFLSVCILIEQLAREFPAFIQAEQKMPTRLKRLDKAADELRAFVVEQTTRPPASDLLTVWIGGETPASVEAMTRGLDLLSKLIEVRRDASGNIVARLGATRKKHRPNAAIIAAVQNLAGGVRELTDTLHAAKIRVLAPVVLGKQISEETMTYALREGRQPLWPLIRSTRARTARSVYGGPKKA